MPELLSPAGDWECVRAAVANGANAIYFGLPTFNARLRAENFTEEDLPRLMDYLHERNVKGYVAFNTLIFTGELQAAERQLILLARAGVDAAIVQDLGLAHLAQRVAPDFHVHASTQMTITSPEGLRFASRLGITRAVVARELSLRELAKFGEDPTVPLEVFVHGALCVAYSGQCLTSEALGQRSANRGECAQACRMPYTMIVDGVQKDLGDKHYLLSPQDLAALDEIPDLIRLGVTSFKIEGRLKSPEYVAAITKVYREAIDRASTPGTAADIAGDRYTMEMAFSRGLSSGWMHGVNHQELVHARFGKKRGPFVGLVTKVARDHVEFSTGASASPAIVPPRGTKEDMTADNQQKPSTRSALKPGDGIVFDTGGDTDKEQGGRVYEIYGSRLYFQHGKLDFARLKVGDRIWKTDDPALNRALRRSFENDPAKTARALSLQISGRAGEPLVLGTSLLGKDYNVSSTMPLQPARNQPLTESVLRDKLGRLGETGFTLSSLTSHLEGDLALPVSELNRMRRDLIAQLPANDAPPAPIAIHDNILPTLLSEIREKPHLQNEYAQLSVLCRTLPQIEAALASDVPLIYVDFEDIRRYKDAVALVRASGTTSRIYLATPRIQKAGEQGFFKLIESANPHGVLIRNLGAIDYFRDLPFERIGDFSLNVANPITARLLQDEGLQRLTVSYDLNATQVLDLLRAAPASWFEITLHQHMPMFHMEHCVFAAFLSTGTDHTNCGRPCDTHEIKLRDRVGLEHPVKADVGCRNTVFHGKAQSGATCYSDFFDAGARTFRVELMLESAEQTTSIISSYQMLIRSAIRPSELITRLAVDDKLGVTLGSLEVKQPHGFR